MQVIGRFNDSAMIMAIKSAMSKQAKVVERRLVSFSRLAVCSGTMTDRVNLQTVKP
jgi:hypothetical protein